MTISLQDLIRLLAQYRRRLDNGDNLDPAELLRVLIAEIDIQWQGEQRNDRTDRGL